MPGEMTELPDNPDAGSRVPLVRIAAALELRLERFGGEVVVIDPARGRDDEPRPATNMSGWG